NLARNAAETLASKEAAVGEPPIINSSQVLSLLSSIKEPGFVVLKEPHITLAHSMSEPTKDCKFPKKLFESHIKVSESVARSGAGAIVVDCESDYLVADSHIVGLRVSSMLVRTNSVPNGVDICHILAHPHTCPAHNSASQALGRGVALDSFPTPNSGELEIACTNAVPHITLAYHKTRKPRETNNLMLETFGSSNAKAPIPTTSKMARVVVPIRLKFAAALASFLY
ncbi:hypothetical protein AYI68_g5866, partial [Smittium mucronatum]